MSGWRSSVGAAFATGLTGFWTWPKSSKLTIIDFVIWYYMRRCDMIWYDMILYYNIYIYILYIYYIYIIYILYILYYIYIYYIYIVLYYMLELAFVSDPSRTRKRSTLGPTGIASLSSSQFHPPARQTQSDQWLSDRPGIPKQIATLEGGSWSEWAIQHAGKGPCKENASGKKNPKSCEYVWMTFVLQHFFNFFLTTTQTSAQTWPWLFSS